MIEAQIQQLDAAQLDAAFGETPDATPTADSLIVGKQYEQPVVQMGSNGLDSIPQLPEDAFEADADTPEAAAAALEAKKIADAAAAAATPADGDDTPPTDEPPTEEDTDPVTEVPEVKTVLKNTVDYLIKSGQWADFEGREDLEMTQEIYAELALKQNENKVQEMFSELIDETGDYGKAIISHIKKGGNPDEVIDIFKEQKAVEALDVSSETGKQTLIEKYYTEVLGWKPEKVAKTIKRLVEDNEIESEFADAKESYDKHFQKKLTEANEVVEQQERVQKQRQDAFITNIKTALESETDLTPKDKKLIASSILDFKHKLDNGQKVNDFYVKFAEMQADPKKYIQLVRYVMNPEGFQKQIAAKIETKVSKDTFNFIKGNAAVGKAKTTPVEITPAKDRTTAKGTDFSFALKNN